MDISELLRQAKDGYEIPCYNENGDINLFARSYCGDTLIHVAVGRQSIIEVEYLIKHGLDINIRGDFFETPLYSACASGKLAMVGLLLKLGADPAISDHRGELPRDALFNEISTLSKSYLEELLTWSHHHPIIVSRDD